jgi:hypothetical protein
LLTSVKQAAGVATARGACQNECVADKKQKNRYIDPGWPALDGDDDHAVSEAATDRTGALSPFGDLTFPLAPDEIPYTHPITVVNK